MARPSLRAQIGPFIVIPFWLLERCRDARAVQLYAVLAKYANRERRAWPKRAELLTQLNASPRSLARAIAALKDLGALDVVIKHRQSDGAVIGADYVLIQEEPKPAAATSQSATDGIQASDTPIETDGNESGSDQNATGGTEEKPLLPPAPILSATGGIHRSKEEPDPFNQIQEQEESTSLPRVFGGVEPDPTDPCDVFRCTWNATVTEPLKRVATLTPKRRRAIRAALAAYPLDRWREIFARVTASRFCRGEKGWLASFDWIIATPDAAVKVLEGQYDDVTRAPARADVGLVSHAFACPHDEPKCGNRWRCAQRTALDAARAGRTA